MEKNKILSLEDRIPKIKKYNQKKANRRLILILTLFFLLIAIIVYFQSPYSQVNKIEVDGNHLITNEQVQEMTNIKQGISIWKIGKKTAISKLKELPYIQDVEISTQFPNNVKILIKEFTPIGYLHGKEGISVVLETGEIVKNNSAAKKLSDYPLLFGFKEGELLTKLSIELSQLPPEVLNVISEIYYSPKETDKYHMYMYTNDGYEINATIPTFASKMSNYRAIISQLDPKVKGVIDLEVGAFFRAYDEEGEKQDEQTKKN